MIAAPRRRDEQGADRIARELRRVPRRAMSRTA
jgi:hypothetical protein